jgi:hypothetical protein
MRRRNFLAGVAAAVAAAGAPVATVLAGAQATKKTKKPDGTVTANGLKVKELKYGAPGSRRGVTKHKQFVFCYNSCGKGIYFGKGFILEASDSFTEYEIEWLFNVAEGRTCMDAVHYLDTNNPGRQLKVKDYCGEEIISRHRSRVQQNMCNWLEEKRKRSAAALADSEESRLLTKEDISDLVNTTLRDLGPMRLQQVADSLQYYKTFSKWFRSPTG